MGREARAIQLAIVNAVLGAALKLTAGLYTGSLSLVSSAVDSFGDLFISVANLGVLRYSAQAPDDDHNYGHAKIEGFGAMFEGGFIFAGAAFIVYESIRRLISGEVANESWIGALVMVPVLAMTITTVWYMRKVAAETGSLVLRSDALHYASDVALNGGVLGSLIVVKLTGWHAVDPIVSIGIAGSMAWASLNIVREGFGVLMDESLDAEAVTAVRAVLTGQPEVRSFHDLRTRKGKVPDVDVHIVVDPDMTARQLHDLFVVLQARIREVTGPETRTHIHADTEED